MELQFKKLNIKSDDRQFVLQYTDKKTPVQKYYTDFKSLINALPNKILLKSEKKKIDDLIKELDELYKFINENIKG